MARNNKKRNLLDDVIEGVRQILDDLDTLLNPDRKKQRARVPVPVRSRDPHDPRNHPPQRR